MLVLSIARERMRACSNRDGRPYAFVMKVGMLNSATRYKVTDTIATEASKYTTICEFESREVFEKRRASNVLAATRENTKAVMGGKDVVWTGPAFHDPMLHFGE
jgi:hypothetical protein